MNTNYRYNTNTNTNQYKSQTPSSVLTRQNFYSCRKCCNYARLWLWGCNSFWKCIFFTEPVSCRRFANVLLSAGYNSRDADLFPVWWKCAPIKTHWKKMWFRSCTRQWHIEPSTISELYILFMQKGGDLIDNYSSYNGLKLGKKTTHQISTIKNMGCL